jgi:hypothetical protein
VGYNYEMFARAGSAEGAEGAAAESAMKIRLAQKAENFFSF